MIKGIRKICSKSKTLSKPGEYLQINYNPETGEAWANYHYSLGYNSWTEYNNPAIIVCGRITKPTTMKNIEAMIEVVLERR